MRRIGVLMNVPADDPIAPARFNAFVLGLGQLGWTDGHNMTIDVRWGAPDAGRYRRDAAELVALKPEILLAASGATVPALTETTRTIPIVFLTTPDPVGSGFVEEFRRGRVATSPASRRSSSAWAENGWSCCRSWRRASREPPSFAIPSIPPGSASSGPSAPQARRWDRRAPD